MSIAISFFLRKDKIDKKGGVPVFCRISYKGARVDFQTGIKSFLDRWLLPLIKLEKNGDQIFIKGSSEFIKAQNKLLNQMRARVLSAYNEAVASGEEIILKRLKARAKGEEDRGITLVQAMERSLNRVTLRKTTKRKMKVACTNLRLFLRDECKKDDIYLADLLKDAYKGFDIKYVEWCTTKTTVRFDGTTRLPKKHYTAVREIRYLRNAINQAIERGEMVRNPLVAKFTIPKGERPQRIILTLEELKKIMEVDLSDKRGMDRIRDCFVFQCLTGLAFIDITTLNKKHLLTKNDRTWIIKDRVKSLTTAKIPLVARAVDIIEKYKDDPVCLSKGRLIPVITNKNYNTYLQMIAEYVGIEKHLTSHVGRRTFATLVYNAGTDRSKLKEMTGHSTETITEIYANLASDTIESEINKFENLFLD